MSSSACSEHTHGQMELGLERTGPDWLFSVNIEVFEGRDVVICILWNL